jgi:hypothetical protein
MISHILILQAIVDFAICLARTIHRHLLVVFIACRGYKWWHSLLRQDIGRNEVKLVLALILEGENLFPFVAVRVIGLSLATRIGRERIKRLSASPFLDGRSGHWVVA